MGETLRVDQNHPQRDVLERACDVLAGGGTIVAPTDSVYGISCAALPGNPGHERIFELKRRDRSLTLPLLLADLGDFERCATAVPAWGRRLAVALWPGALTIVVRASREVPSDYLRDNGTVALRVPDSELYRALIRMAGVPLATTSANIHGMPAAACAAELDPRLVSGADLTLDGGASGIGIASTIVDATGAEPRIVRYGALSAADVERACHGTA